MEDGLRALSAEEVVPCEPACGPFAQELGRQEEGILFHAEGESCDCPGVGMDEG